MIGFGGSGSVDSSLEPFDDFVLNKIRKKAQEDQTFQFDLENGLTLELFLPASASSFSKKKPFATATLEEQISFPRIVGKKLLSKLKSDNLHIETQQELEEYISKLEEEAIHEKALRLINKREYSRKELSRKLERDGFGQQAIENIANNLEEMNLLSDDRFAEMYINASVVKGWGRERIERELEQKGINVEELDGWPDAFLKEDEADRAYNLLEYKCIPDKDPYQKLLRFLASRGYSYGPAKEAVIKKLEEK